MVVKLQYMKRLEEMSLSELWELFPIVLTEHNPDWCEWASEEIGLLKELLSPVKARYYHVGSTAVRGIWAKPIVDIIVTVADVTAFVEAKDRLKSGGYICMSDSALRASFNKGYTPNDMRNGYFISICAFPAILMKCFSATI